MACATLKRSLDFDPVCMHRPSKRQRCTPMSVSPSSSPPSYRNGFGYEMGSSPFVEIVPKMTAETMAVFIREEIKRMYHRRQLHFTPNPEVRENQGVNPSPGYVLPSFDLSSSDIDKPLFSFRQVGMICERMLSERENHIRDEYDRTLNMKLSDQYDSFVRFSNDQLSRRFDVSASPSYLS